MPQRLSRLEFLFKTSLCHGDNPADVASDALRSRPRIVSNIDHYCRGYVPVYQRYSMVSEIEKKQGTHKDGCKHGLQLETPCSIGDEENVRQQQSRKRLTPVLLRKTPRLQVFKS